MKCYYVQGQDVSEGIEVELTPYAHVALGKEGYARETWIPLYNPDAGKIVQKVMMGCPNRKQKYPYVGRGYLVCENCGESYVDASTVPWLVVKPEAWQVHPEAGEVAAKTVINFVSVVSLRDGKHLVVAPKQKENGVLVHWKVSAGRRDDLDVRATRGVNVVASHNSVYSTSERYVREHAVEIFATLSPGQELYSTYSLGGMTEDLRGHLLYDGVNVRSIIGQVSQPRLRIRCRA